MASLDMKIPMTTVARNIQATIRVTGTRRFNVRIRLMLVLLNLAAWVSPIDTKIEVEQ